MYHKAMVVVQEYSKSVPCVILQTHDYVCFIVTLYYVCIYICYNIVYYTVVSYGLYKLHNYVTGFAKTVPNGVRTEIQFID